MNPKIESIHIRGFRSLADVRISNMSNATVLIGANGSGKSNFIRFFEMLRWMIYSRLGEFVAIQGGADDQLFGGNARTPHMGADIKIRTDYGLIEFNFALTYAQPDRFIFADEQYRVTVVDIPTDPSWVYLGSAHTEANIVTEAYSTPATDLARVTASVVAGMLRAIAIYQFHDTSNSSSFKKLCDLSDNLVLRADGGNLAAILYRLERLDVRRYNLICRQISRVLPGFDRFELADECCTSTRKRHTPTACSAMWRCDCRASGLGHGRLVLEL